MGQSAPPSARPIVDDASAPRWTVAAGGRLTTERLRCGAQGWTPKDGTTKNTPCTRTPTRPWHQGQGRGRVSCCEALSHPAPEGFECGAAPGPPERKVALTFSLRQGFGWHGQQKVWRRLVEMGRIESLAPTRTPRRCTPVRVRRCASSRLILTFRAGVQTSPKQNNRPWSVVLVEMGRIELPSGESRHVRDTDISRFMHVHDGDQERARAAAMGFLATLCGSGDWTPARGLMIWHPTFPYQASGRRMGSALRREPWPATARTRMRTRPSLWRRDWQLFVLTVDLRGDDLPRSDWRG